MKIRLGTWTGLGRPGCKSGFRDKDPGSRFCCVGFWVSGFGFQVTGFASRASGHGSKVSGFGSRISGFGYRCNCLGSLLEEGAASSRDDHPLLSSFAFRAEFGVQGSGIGVRVFGFEVQC